MFNRRNGKNHRPNDPYKTVAKICPFSDSEDFTSDDFTLSDDGNDTGWYFQCKICKDSGCRGFIKK